MKLTIKSTVKNASSKFILFQMVTYKRESSKEMFPSTTCPFSVVLNLIEKLFDLEFGGVSLQGNQPGGRRNFTVERINRGRNFLTFLDDFMFSYISQFGEWIILSPIKQILTSKLLGACWR